MIINPLVAFLGGIVVGLLLTLILIRVNVVGTLRIDHTSADKDLYLFDIEKDLSILDGKDFITLRIDHDANLSQ